MAAFFGKLLILDLDCLNPGIFVAAHRVLHVQRPAKAGIRIGDQRCAGALRHLRRPADHIGIGGIARIGLAQIGGGDAIAGHVNGMKAHAVGRAGRDQIKNTGRQDKFTVSQALGDGLFLLAHIKLFLKITPNLVFPLRRAFLQECADAFVKVCRSSQAGDKVFLHG